MSVVDGNTYTYLCEKFGNVLQDFFSGFCLKFYCEKQSFPVKHIKIVSVFVCCIR